MTFAQDIEEAAGEPILVVAVGGFGWDSGPDENAYTFDRDKRAPFPERMKRRPIAWALARPYLDYEHDSGFGAPECHAVYAWTENWVVFVSTYDGTTTVERIPRSPTDVDPTMPGGG